MTDDFLKLVPEWDVEQGKTLFETRLFTAHERHCRSRITPEKNGTFVYLETTDWVNVVPLTTDEHVVMIEQFRHGTCEVTLELPGGMVDPGEDPLNAAVRELREETGYTGEGARLIGSVTPNPAILSNRCHTAYLHDVRKTDPQSLDGREEIAVRLVDLREIPQLVARGIIHHALVIAAFYHHEILRGQQPSPAGKS